MKKKLPVLGKPTPASSQRGLSVTPVAAGSKPEFPTRKDLYRKAGILGGIGGAVLSAGIATAGAPGAKPMPPGIDQSLSQPDPNAKPPANPEALANGSIDGQPLDKAAPKFKVYRSGGGIGPAEDMWDVSEVEAYLNWTMAKEGKLNIKTAYKLDFDGFTYELDGFDPDKNIGYAYTDKLHGDRDFFTKDMKAKIAAWQKAKKVAILWIDVPKNPDASTLKGKVLKFMGDVKKNPPATGALSAAPADAPNAAPAASQQKLK